MRPNKIQTVIRIVCGTVLLALFLWPPWQQAAEREVSYRKNIGRSFLWNPPKPVAVDCYFVGCVMAPATYFHALLNRKLLLQQCLTLFFVAVLFLWTFRPRQSGKTATLNERATRLVSCLLLALLVPPTGDVPLGAVLAGIPMVLVRRDELWLMPTIMAILMYVVCALIIYGFVSTAVWLVASPHHFAAEREP